MNLVGYSDSESSDNEARPFPKPTQIKKPAAAPSKKPTFQKLVDRSNPHKIRLNLPTINAAETTEGDDIHGPPAKRARTEGGLFSGFNSLLPPPKRTAQMGAASGVSTLKRGPGKGLGSGFSLKTAAEPAFSREPGYCFDGGGWSEDTGYDEFGKPQKLAMSAEKGAISNTTSASYCSVPGEAKPAPKPMFKPLSVANRQKKKKISPHVAMQPLATPTSSKTVAQPGKALPTEARSAPKPKVPLFSFSQEEVISKAESSQAGEYTPLLYNTTPEAAMPQLDPTQSHSEPSSIPSAPPPDNTSLTAIADDLDLPDSVRRQLFGRQGGSASSAIKIVNFNTDAEYAANEALRASGETVQPKAVRSIAPGKHSLKQLVNAANSQREALEEHFAAMKGNKKEAGSRYGW